MAALNTTHFAGKLLNFVKGKEIGRMFCESFAAMQKDVLMTKRFLDLIVIEDI